MEKEDLFGEAQKESATYGEWSQKITPQQAFPLKDGSATITIDQNYKGIGELGTRVWNGGLVLGRYVERLGAGFFQGKSCVELGSGTGLTGVIAAKVGADIVLTDKQALLPLIDHNIRKNLNEQERARIRTSELLWGTGNPFGKGFDLVLGADLTYDFEDLPPLVETFSALSCSDAGENKSTEILLAYGKERAAIEPFLEQVRREWDVTLVPDEHLDDCDITFPTFTIGIMHLTKKKEETNPTA